ncbi:MAG: DivIVA domain-containing protein [Fibrobacterota bacterium]
MPMTAMDIRRQTFKTGFKGYRTDEVGHFLEMVADRFEELMKERDEHAGRISGLERELAKYEKLETTLHNMMQSSQKTLEESKVQAQHEATLIVREAEVRAEEIKRDAEKALKEIRDSSTVLKEQKNTFIVKFRTLIKSQLDLLHLMDSDTHAPDRPSHAPDDGRDHTIHLSSAHDMGAKTP